MPGRVWVAHEREAMRGAPVVDPTRPLLREHELAICAHYGIGETIGRAAEVAGRAAGSVTAQPAFGSASGRTRGRPVACWVFASDGAAVRGCGWGEKQDAAAPPGTPPVLSGADQQPSWRAITICCTSSVPSPMVRILASR